MYDYLIVGAGLYGAVFAHLAHLKGKRCIVIDRRPHLGGNVHCDLVEGIDVHQYGAHIFHTSNYEVWSFVNSLVPFNRFTNAPIADYKGERYNLPFNMNTFYQMWRVRTPEEAKAKIEQQKKAVQELLHGTPPRNLEEQALLMVGTDIYEKLVKGYSEKQWGRPCSELPPSIISRLPVRYVYDNNYFSDTYQGIPIGGGYNALIDKLLDGIECRTRTDYFADREFWDSIAKTIVFTGEIDRFYDYRFGKLEWRTVRFEHKVLECANFQGNAVVNYTDKEIPYTRIIEHKHFTAFGEAVYDNPKTVVSYEYSTEWKSGMEPYYPVGDARNTELYKRYKALADAEAHVHFGGRLAEYKYYDMAPVIETVMLRCKTLLEC